MPLARIQEVGSAGIIRDQFPADMPVAAWTDGMNVQFRDGYARKSPGYESSLGTPTVAPYGVFYTPSNTTRFFAYLGTAKAYCTDGSTHTDITPAAGDFTGAATNKWVGGMLTGIFVVTNGVDAPQYWVPSASNDLAALTNFTASTTCRSIRPFKNHLIAMDLTQSGTRKPFLVRWSHPADPGSVPSSWDITDTTKDAGEIDLADTTGAVIDGGALGDVFLVWKQNATYALRYVGPPYIFSSQKVTEQSGILAANCWCETPLGLVVLTLGDVVLHVGDQAPRSIIDGTNRRWLAANISSDNYANSFVVHNEDESEVWVCFPSAAATYCDTALVWNYASNTWGVRTLPSTNGAAVGYVASASVTWDSLSSTGWDSSGSIWDAGVSTLVSPRIVMASAGNTKLYAMDSTELADGSAQTTRLERSGLHFDMPERVKLVRAVRPRIDGATGAVVNVYVGASMDVDQSPTWSGPYAFTVGSTLKIDCLVSGRYIGVRYESDENTAWRLRGFDVDLEPMGGY